MILHLVLKHKWFEQISLGLKDIEYREINDYWTKRIWGKKDQIKGIIFHRGYTNQTLYCDVIKIDIGLTPYPELPGSYYRLYLEKPKKHV